MKISGSGKLSEMNVNDNIKVSGSVKMDGNIECLDFKSSGSARGEGNLIAHGDIKSSGSFRILGNLYGDRNAKFSGSATIGEEIKVNGIFEIKSVSISLLSQSIISNCPNDLAVTK